jgi:YhcH/YjgK/YiaL family protein
MVIDKLENSDIYSTLGENIKLAFDYLKQNDFSKISAGKYEIDGDAVFAMVSEYETKEVKDGRLESHRKYLDVQYAAKGNELIGYVPFKNQKPTIEYNETNDIMFYLEENSFVKLEEGMFAIFFPSDIHMPGIKINTSEKVKKVVVKVRV